MNPSVTRRQWLMATAAGLGGVSLPSVLQLRAAAGETSRDRTAVIFVTMGGGASQFETFDPKPEAPAEYRGIFGTIPTTIAGARFCELLPRLARMTDRLSILRSVHHEQASHIAEHIVETGYDLVNPTNSRTGEMPSIGAAVSRLRGIGPSGIPAYVSIPKHHAYAGAHWLGAQHHFFPVDGDPNDPAFSVQNLALTGAMTVERMRERQTLRSAFSQKARQAEKSSELTAIEQFSQQAFDLITGDRAQRAFQISLEDPRLRDRYGRTDVGQRLLLARRLVEADVPFVTVRMGDWDDHDKLSERIQPRAAKFDQGLSALIEDLGERGMNRDVLVIAMGEFGRTPRINANAGRDHYPAVNSVLLSGGRYAMGRILGATDAKGIQVTEAPYRPQNVLGMVYRHLGIDPATTFPDYAGRPRPLLEERDPIVELT